MELTTYDNVFDILLNDYQDTGSLSDNPAFERLYDLNDEPIDFYTYEINYTELVFYWHESNPNLLLLNIWKLCADHNPTHADKDGKFKRFWNALVKMGLAVNLSKKLNPKCPLYKIVKKVDETEAKSVNEKIKGKYVNVCLLPQVVNLISDCSGLWFNMVENWTNGVGKGFLYLIQTPELQGTNRYKYGHIKCPDLTNQAIRRECIQGRWHKYFQDTLSLINANDSVIDPSLIDKGIMIYGFHESNNCLGDERELGKAFTIKFGPAVNGSRGEIHDCSGFEWSDVQNLWKEVIDKQDKSKPVKSSELFKPGENVYRENVK